MGYDGPMGYGLKIPTYQTGGYKTLWTIRGYGLYGLWVKRGLTVAEIMGGCDDSSRGCITRREMVINRINEGGIMPSMNSAVLTVIFIVVDMVFNAMIGLSSSNRKGSGE
jgi:hypothetical protein